MKYGERVGNFIDKYLDRIFKDEDHINIYLSSERTEPDIYKQMAWELFGIDSVFSDSFKGHIQNVF